MPIVSVIIPVYNRAHLISESIESVLKQSFQDFEIIVVDDGSTDNTGEVISRFPVRYIRQKNQGPPEARNTGIRAARGKYIATLDSDDTLFEYSLGKGVAILEEHPETAFSYGQIKVMDENSRILRTYKPHKGDSRRINGKQEIHDLVYYNYIPASSVLIRKSCLASVGLYNTTFRRGSEDLELWIRLCSKFDSAYIAEPLANWRVHDSRLTDHLSIDEYEQSHTAIIESVFNNPALSPLVSSEHERIYFHLYLSLAKLSLGRRKTGRAVGYLFKGLNTYPLGVIGPAGLQWLTTFGKTITPQTLIDTVRNGRNMLLKKPS